MDKRIPWEIADLIVAQWDGLLSEEETRQLEQWISVSPHHKLLYEQWRRGKNFETFEEKAEEHDYLPYYQDLCRRVSAAKRTRWLKRCSIAAAVAVPLMMCLILMYPREQVVPVADNSSIVPGQYRAMLTLPGGEMIPLAQVEGEMKIKECSAVVRRDTLTYEKQVEQVEEEWHKISIPRGGEYILKLADGTRVWLNSETELRFPAAFQGGKRKVVLKGEVYFEVARDTLHPFVVETGKQVLTVLGTSFAVRAYGDENRILTTLETGKVQIESQDKRVVLTPGYQAQYLNGQIEVKKVNTTLYTAWHRGKFVFVNQPLEEILNTLSRWYNMEVFFNNKALGKICFTGELQRYGEISELLANIEVLEKVRFEVKGRTVTVSDY